MTASNFGSEPELCMIVLLSLRECILQTKVFYYFDSTELQNRYL